MVRKLNRKAAETYSQNFSRRVLDDFFSKQPAATGQDILELTPVHQVNLLVIQRLYQRWQQEALQLRSAYFDFGHPQVQESLQAFMNTLSRHIQVEREALEPLLQEATLDTLRLLFNPMAFFAEFIGDYLKPESLQASLRYLRMQQALTDTLHEQIEKKETTETEYLLAILEAGIGSGRLELEPVEEHVQAFEQVLLFPKGLVEEQGPAAPLPPKEEATDFFSTISGMSPRPARTAPKEEEAPKAQEAATPKEPAPAPIPPAPKVSEPEPAIARAPTPTAAPEPAAAPPAPAQNSRPEVRAAAPTVIVPAQEPAPAPKKQDEEHGRVNARFDRSEKKPLYEKFEQKEPRAATISQKQRSSNIRHYITLNQRFMFVKELFGGDGGAFNAALDALDSCKTMGEAQQWVQEHLAPKPQWQDDSEVVHEFQNVLEHRFGS